VRCVVVCSSQLFCHQSSGQSLRTFSCSHYKTLDYYVELTVWPARMNSLWTIPLMGGKKRKIDNHAPEFSLHLSQLFWSWWVWTFQLGGFLLCLRVRAINLALITSDNPRQEGRAKSDAHSLFLCQIHCIRPDTLQIKGCKKSAHPPKFMKFCTLTPKICHYYDLLLYHAKAVVHMAVPVL
jgi:hypothetical protein